jgi:putative transcriptional regulator
MNIEKVAKAIQDDAGVDLPELKQSLKEMQASKSGRAYTDEQLLVISTRKLLNLSQREFAVLIQTPVGTLRDWEQGATPTPGCVIVLLKIIEDNPSIIEKVA